MRASPLSYAVIYLQVQQIYMKLFYRLTRGPRRPFFFGTTCPRPLESALWNRQEGGRGLAQCAWCSRRESLLVDSPKNDPVSTACRIATPEQTLNDA